MSHYTYFCSIIKKSNARRFLHLLRCSYMRASLFSYLFSEMSKNLGRSWKLALIFILKRATRKRLSPRLRGRMKEILKMKYFDFISKRLKPPFYPKIKGAWMN